MKKYLITFFAAFLVISLAFGGFFYVVLSETRQALLAEKVIERQIDLELICRQLDKFIEVDNDWNEYDYERIIGYTFEYLDGVEMTFAAAYDWDLTEISTRYPSYENAPFEPTLYPAFIEAVLTEESGIIDLYYADVAHGVKGRTMKTVFRWIPSDKTLDNRFLTVVAVSEYSVKTDTLNWVWVGALGVIIFAGGVCLVYLHLLTSGTRRTTRKGEKT